MSAPSTQNPEALLSPAPSGEEGRLQRSALLRIADLTIALTSDDSTLTLPVEGANSQFLVREDEPDVHVRARWENLGEISSGRKVFDSGGLWQLFAANGALRFHFTSPAWGPLPYKVAWFDKEFASGEVVVHRPYFPRGHLVYPLEYPLDELLLIHLLAAGRGVEVHACGVVDASGQGYLFAGQSGAGKTTMARLWQKTEEVQVLSDDRIILRYQSGRFWMYGTPWHGEAGLSSPARAPLKGVYLLRHGPSNRLVPLRRSSTAARLVACSFPPFYHSSGLDFTLGFLDQLVEAVPCYELSFTPDERVIALVRSS